MSVILFSLNNDITKRIISFVDALPTDDVDKLLSSLSNSEDNLLIIDDSSESFEKLLENIKDRFPLLKIFVLSNKPNFENGKNYLELGIKGYGNIFISKDNLQQAIEIINNGDIWLYPEFIQSMIKNIVSNSEKQKNQILDTLSKKEKKVARLLSQGLSNKEIAANLDITEITVKSHLRSIYQKTRTKNRLSLALLYKNS